MTTMLIAVLLALWVIRELTDWGLSTFGLLGWWLVLPFIGGIVGLSVALVGGLVSQVVARGRVR